MQRLTSSFLATRYYSLLSVASATGGCIGSYLKYGFLEAETILDYATVALVLSTLITLLYLIFVKKP